jgi:DNA invertase Pin-like site-specific DNA recombinase
MTVKPAKRVRCAVYTRVSTEYGRNQEFNSLDAQHEAAEAYIRSQAHDGWTLVRTRYDDGGYSGGSTERPALQRLLADIRDRRIDIVVVYKVDRLTRSLADFAKLVELFDAHGVSFVSVTQQFNTTTSMGRLTLNVLLSFAQFEREVTSERIRDKIGASKRKGLWVGGMVPLGYVSRDKKLFIEEEGPSASARSSSATSTSAVSGYCWPTFGSAESSPKSACSRMGGPLAASPSPEARSPISCTTDFISVKWHSKTRSARVSIQPFSIVICSRQSS